MPNQARPTAENGEQGLMRYPGSKALPGVFQTIINNIPPHQTYIETHLGGGNILERKKPAQRSVGVDLDAD
ncbi:MAG: hypothetical protein IPM01_29465, partial [Burkholderiaceae bacterium]|nr:hypothetical protein [Burkholderiaceae bacterium]